MSECQLVLERIRQKSRAKRILWFFKPEEIITWEPFDLYLLFRNNSDKEFPGGKCTFKIIQPTIRRNYEINMPLIKPRESQTVLKENLLIDETGYAGLTLLQVENIEHKYVPCVDPEGKETRNPKGSYALFITNREELSQKYAVVIALFFSALATILTIVNVIVSIFR